MSTRYAPTPLFRKWPARTRRWSAILLAWSLLMGVVGCGDDGEARDAQLIAVLSPMPAELAPLVARAEVKEAVTVDRWRFRRATLAGKEVILVVTGIGMANASAAARAAFNHFPVRGVLLSGVAGSRFPIGDVVVPVAWRSPDGSEFPVPMEWALTARELTGRRIPLDRCTEIPNRPESPPVCLDRLPVVRTLGVGVTTDRFGSQPIACQPNGGDVFGCDVDTPTSMHGGALLFSAPVLPRETIDDVVAEDMEGAAVAQEATRAGLPFIAFRGVSDGPGDPLGLPGFTAQFFAYYRLAARNAATVTVAFLERLDP